MFEGPIEFLRRNSIRFMPVRLNGKGPAPIRSRHFLRPKKDGKGMTYVPSYTEFKTISNELLEKRIEMMESFDVNALGVDTYETFQIDVDTPDIDPDTIAYMVANFPHHKSATKDFGYHFFIRIKDFDPPKVIIQFHNIVNGKDAGHLELLCGQWGYLKAGRTIINADKPIPVFECDDDYNLTLPDSFVLSLNYKKPPTKSLSGTIVADPTIAPPPPEQLPHPEGEIADHVANIDAVKYISSHNHHFKICCALFAHGYAEIAYTTIDRIVNPKYTREEMTEKLNSWQRANVSTISMRTIFYYSKESDKRQFSTLLKKWRGASLPSIYRKELKLNPTMITEKINRKYLGDLLSEKITSDREHQAVFVKSHLGTGKTTSMTSLIRALPEDTRIIYFAPRIAFARDIQSALAPHGFSIYLDIKKKTFNYNRVIVQVESLHKFESVKYDIVVIDEIESVFKQLTSKDTNKNISKTYRVFDALIKNTPKVIGLDAFLSQHSIDMVAAIKNRPTMTSVVVNDYQPYKRIATELKDLAALQKQAVKQIRSGEHIVIVSMSSKDGKLIHNYITEKIPSAKVKFYYGKMSQKEKKFGNVHEEWGDLDALIYTPIITCGVNFDPPTPWFHTLYIWAHPMSCVVRDVFQASLRVRKLIKNDCYFAISRAGYHPLFRSENVRQIGATDITANIAQLREAMRRDSRTYEAAYDWAVTNLVFKENEAAISRDFLYEMFMEYFRLCGYSVTPLPDVGQWFDQNDEGNLEFPIFGSIPKPDDVDYAAMERNRTNLTEEQKLSMRKYELIQLLPGITDVEHSLQSELWESFLRNPRHIHNLLAERRTSTDDHIAAQTNCPFDILAEPDIQRHDCIRNIKRAFGAEMTYSTAFTSNQVADNIGELFDIMVENRGVFKLRSPQGTTHQNYVIRCLKHILQEWTGQFIKTKRTQQNNERFRLYYFDTPHFVKAFECCVPDAFDVCIL